ncbi:unnamed protein product [Parascedosporium putredinis]|uniref:Uncharacterized protein n=1 Tax=Parascedosporium putredinis TaxID=1442378 RepID=A0A9P1GVU5_9PEZI|nr:unnamed protein product [Parascedosporium putredinis]CAI7988266.1 unnamed protein product [Parascedosporium putredinis]
MAQSETHVIASDPILRVLNRQLPPFTGKPRTSLGVRRAGRSKHDNNDESARGSHGTPMPLNPPGALSDRQRTSCPLAPLSCHHAKAKPGRRGGTSPPAGEKIVRCAYSSHDFHGVGLSLATRAEVAANLVGLGALDPPEAATGPRRPERDAGGGQAAVAKIVFNGLPEAAKAKVLSLAKNAYLGMPHKERRKYLKESWGFDCTCPLCLADEATREGSDARRMAITIANEYIKLGDWEAAQISAEAALAGWLQYWGKDTPKAEKGEELLEAIKNARSPKP